MPNPLVIQDNIQGWIKGGGDLTIIYLAEQMIYLCDCIIEVQGEIELLQQQFSPEVYHKLKGRE